MVQPYVSLYSPNAPDYKWLHIVNFRWKESKGPQEYPVHRLICQSHSVLSSQGWSLWKAGFTLNSAIAPACAEL